MTHANRAAKAGLLALGLTTSGAVWLVFDLVSGPVAAAIAGGSSLLFFVAVWAIYPLAGHRRESPTYYCKD